MQAARVYDKTSYFLYGQDAVTNFGIEAASSDSISLPSNVYHIRARYDRWRAEHPKQPDQSPKESPQALFAFPDLSPASSLQHAATAPAAIGLSPAAGAAFSPPPQLQSSSAFSTYYSPQLHSVHSNSQHPRDALWHTLHSRGSLPAMISLSQDQAGSSCSTSGPAAFQSSCSAKGPHAVGRNDPGVAGGASPDGLVTSTACPMVGSSVPGLGKTYILTSLPQYAAPADPTQLVWMPTNQFQAAEAATAAASQQSPFYQQLLAAQGQQQQLQMQQLFVSAGSPFMHQPSTQLHTPNPLQQQPHQLQQHEKQGLLQQRYPAQFQHVVLQPQQIVPDVQGSASSQGLLQQDIGFQPGCYHQLQQQQPKLLTLPYDSGLAPACPHMADGADGTAPSPLMEVHGLIQQMGMMKLQYQQQQQGWVTGGDAGVITRFAP